MNEKKGMDMIRSKHHKEMRKQAVEWWRGLRDDHQMELAKLYYPDHQFILVTTSTNKIEMIYRQVELEEVDSLI